MEATEERATRQSRDSRAARAILMASMWCSFGLGSVMVVIREPLWMILALGFLSAVGLVWLLKGYLARRSWCTGWMLALAVVNLLIVVPELALRVVDFRYAPGIRGGYRRAVVPGGFTRLVPDEQLFWKVSPEDVKVNSLGFPYKEVSVPKPQRTFRILYLGDSCTQQGYPRFAELFLNAGRSDSETRFESVTLALSGYSSHQGRVMAERWGRYLDPDLAVVYFGWNDHWLAHGATDADKVVSVPRSRWARTMDGLLQRSRLLQGLNQISVTLGGSRVDDILDEVQVPASRYRENLLRIKAVFDQSGIPVIFITAPTAHYRLGVPDYLLDRRFISGKQEAIRLHRQYTQIVRDVARGTGAYVLDLEKELSDRPDVGQIFMSDGIHFVDEGLAVVARRLTEFIEKDVLPNQRLARQ